MSIRRLYESTYIVNAVLEDAEIDTIVDRIVEFLGQHEAQILEMNKWGRRRLAYPIKKKYNGYYVYLVFEAPAEAIPQLERFYILEENIMRHLTVQLDPKLREFRKVRAEAQAARAAQMAEAARSEQFGSAERSVPSTVEKE